MYFAVGIISVISTTRYPPSIPRAILRSIRNGLSRTVERILGSTRKPAELTPIMSIASICSEILMLPISEAMFDPIFPASRSATIVEQNSSTRLSLTIYPTYILSSMGFCMLEAVCITSTPPMNTDITATIRIEESISLSASSTNCFQKILHFSGLRKTIFRKRQ